MQSEDGRGRRGRLFGLNVAKQLPFCIAHLLEPVPCAESLSLLDLELWCIFSSISGSLDDLN